MMGSNVFNEEAVTVLNKVLQTINVTIVISSDMAYHKSLAELRQLYDKINAVPVDAIRFTKPNRVANFAEYCKVKTQDIINYVNEHASIDSWIAIDDITLNIESNHFIRITDGWLKQSYLTEIFDKLVPC